MFALASDRDLRIRWTTRRRTCFFHKCAPRRAKLLRLTPGPARKRSRSAHPSHRSHPSTARTLPKLRRRRVHVPSWLRRARWLCCLRRSRKSLVRRARVSLRRTRSVLRDSPRRLCRRARAPVSTCRVTTPSTMTPASTVPTSLSRWPVLESSDYDPCCSTFTSEIPFRSL